MNPIELKLVMIGSDIASDILMDIYFDMKSKRKETISAEEILEMANKWKMLKSVEIQKIKDRIVENNI